MICTKWWFWEFDTFWNFPTLKSSNSVNLWATEMVFTKKIGQNFATNGLVHLFVTPGQQNAIYDGSFSEKLEIQFFLLIPFAGPQCTVNPLLNSNSKKYCSSIQFNFPFLQNVEYHYFEDWHFEARTSGLWRVRVSQCEGQTPLGIE